jgi:hypothetical protein
MMAVPTPRSNHAWFAALSNPARLALLDYCGQEKSNTRVVTLYNEWNRRRNIVTNLDWWKVKYLRKHWMSIRKVTTPIASAWQTVNAQRYLARTSSAGAPPQLAPPGLALAAVGSHHVPKLGCGANDRLLDEAPSVAAIDAAFQTEEWATTYDNATDVTNELRRWGFMVFDVAAVHVALISIAPTRMAIHKIADELGKLPSVDKLRNAVQLAESARVNLLRMMAGVISVESSCRAALDIIRHHDVSSYRLHYQAVAHKMRPRNKIVTEQTVLDGRYAANVLRTAMEGDNTGDGVAFFTAAIESLADEPLLLSTAFRTLGIAIHDWVNAVSSAGSAAAGGDNLADDARENAANKAIFALLAAALDEHENPSQQDNVAEFLKSNQTQLPADFGRALKRENRFGQAIGSLLNSGSDVFDPARVAEAAAGEAREAVGSMPSDKSRTAIEVIIEKLGEKVLAAIDANIAVFHGKLSRTVWQQQVIPGFKEVAALLHQPRFFPPHDQLLRVFEMQYATYSAALQMKNRVVWIDPQEAVATGFGRQFTVFQRAESMLFFRRKYARQRLGDDGEALAWFEEVKEYSVSALEFDRASSPPMQVEDADSTSSDEGGAAGGRGGGSAGDDDDNDDDEEEGEGGEDVSEIAFAVTQTLALSQATSPLPLAPSAPTGPRGNAVANVQAINRALQRILNTVSIPLFTATVTDLTIMNRAPPRVQSSATSVQTAAPSPLVATWHGPDTLTVHAKLHCDAAIPSLKFIVASEYSVQHRLLLEHGFHKLVCIVPLEAMVQWHEKPGLAGLQIVTIDFPTTIGKAAKANKASSVESLTFATGGRKKRRSKTHEGDSMDAVADAHRWMNGDRIRFTIGEDALKVWKEKLLLLDPVRFIPTFFSALASGTASVPLPAASAVRQSNSRISAAIVKLAQKSVRPIGNKSKRTEVTHQLGVLKCDSDNVEDFAARAHCSCGNVSYINKAGITLVEAVPGEQQSTDECHWCCHACDAPTLISVSPSTSATSSSSSSSAASPAAPAVAATWQLRRVPPPAAPYDQASRDALERKLFIQHPGITRLSLQLFIDAAVALNGTNHREAIMHTHLALAILECDLPRSFYSLIDALLFEGGDGYADTKGAFDASKFLAKLNRLERDTISTPLVFEGRKFYIAIDFVPIDGAALRYLLGTDKGFRWIRPDPHNGIHKELLRAYDPLLARLAFRAPITLTREVAHEIRLAASRGDFGAVTRATNLGFFSSESGGKPLMKDALLPVGAWKAFTEPFHSTTTSTVGVLAILAAQLL